ncbi:MAG TPA: hypothetical protein VL337_02025 [Acidimicrobiales bacterium]|nr:hypothetical protein [Acidimicrobiales bacterium]
MRAIRRGVLALVLAGIAGAAVRLRRGGPVPLQQGGWRELTGPELK